MKPPPGDILLSRSVRILCEDRMKRDLTSATRLRQRLEWPTESALASEFAIELFQVGISHSSIERLIVWTRMWCAPPGWSDMARMHGDQIPSVVKAD